MHLPPEIMILAGDMQLFYSTILTVQSFLEALDLSEQYRKLDGRGRRSPLTTSVAQIAEKLRIYIDDSEEEDEEEDVGVS
jgi:hypothetical protein